MDRNAGRNTLLAIRYAGRKTSLSGRYVSRNVCTSGDRNAHRNTTINDVPLPYRQDPDDEVALSDGRIVVALRTFLKLPRKQSDLRNSYSPSEPFDVLPIPGSASTLKSNEVVILGILFCIIVPITSVEVQ